MSKRLEIFFRRGAALSLLASIALLFVATYNGARTVDNASFTNGQASPLNSIAHSLEVAGISAAILAGLFALLLYAFRFHSARAVLQKRNHQLEALAKSNRRINESLEVPAVMRALIESALDIIGASNGAAGLFKDGQMVFTEYFKNGTWVPIDFSFPPGYGVPGWVIENKKPYLSNNTGADLQVIQEIREQLGFYNLLDTPILNVEGELLGCFEIHNTIGRRPFDEQDILLLESLSASVAIAIENARINTEQKNAAELLSKSESKFRALFENSPNALWEEDFSAVKLFLDDIRRQGVTDLDAFFRTNQEAAIRCARMVRVVDINKKTCELLAARNKNDLLTNLDLVFTEESFRPFIKGLICLAEGSLDYQQTGVNKTLNGELIEVNIHASIVPGYETSWEKIIVAMTDVTREQELNQLKNEFISTAAHELRTPLTVIMGFSDLLIEHLETEMFSIDEKKEFLNNINKKVIALERIVEDLLDISRIETGRAMLLEKTPTQISALLKELIRNHQRETSVHQLESYFDNPELLLALDPGRITQVIDNLLNNAIKYSPDGGTITIRAEQVKDMLEISVIDQGLGLSEEQVDRVFDKFYRADTSTTALGGLGLGMSICKSIVEAHGGRIWIESAPGQGTTVRFTLPTNVQVEPVFTPEIPGISRLQ